MNIPVARLNCLVRVMSTALLLAALSAVAAEAPVPQLQIDLSQPGFPVSPMFYGMMTEEINHAYDGGLYGELVQNRSFKDDPTGPAHWSLVSSGTGNTIALDQTQPINAALATCLKLSVTDVSQGPVGIANEGFWGIPAAPKTGYRASFFAKLEAAAAGPLTVSLESADGRTVYASGQVPALSHAWARYDLVLKTDKITPDAHARLVLATTNTGNYWFNLVSLFPPHLAEPAQWQSCGLDEKTGGSASRLPAFSRRQLSGGQVRAQPLCLGANSGKYFPATRPRRPVAVSFQ